MDDSVLRAMLKWPDVPAVFGWLSLDVRGNWFLKGAPITHPGIQAFLCRNYDHDDQGRYFLQNGPQRVFVSLAATPFVYRFISPTDLVTHCGDPVQNLNSVWLDDHNRMLLETEWGIGLLHDSDLIQAVDQLETAAGGCPDDLPTPHQSSDALVYRWGSAKVPVGTLFASTLPEKFGFDPHPS